jgi:hypothetical protein
MQASKSRKISFILSFFAAISLIFILEGVLGTTSVFGESERQASEPAQPAATIISPAVEKEQTPDKDRDTIIVAYKQHRLEYQKKKENIRNEVKLELKKLTDQLRSLSSDLKTGAGHLKTVYHPQEQELDPEVSKSILRLNENKARYEGLLSTLSALNRGSGFIFSPLAFAAGTHADSVLFIFLPLTILNIFLYLFFQQRPTFTRYKKILIALLVTAFLACATSLLAAPMDKRQEVQSKLHFTEKILALKGNAKAIAILESGSRSQTVLPANLVSGDKWLTVYPTVTTNSPEYYVTLAALYSAEKETEKAVESLKNIAEDTELEGEPNDKIIVDTIHFLVENGHLDIAHTMVTNFAKLITDTNILSDLAQYVGAYSMRDSFSYTMELLEEKSVTTSELLAVASSYYKSGKTDKVQSTLTLAFDASRDMKDILLIASDCIKLQSDSLLEQLPAKMEHLPADPGLTIDLAKLYHEQQEYPLAAAALKLATSQATRLEQLESVTLAAVELKLEFLLVKIREKVILLNPALQKDLSDNTFQQAYAQVLQFVDFLINEKMPANAAKLYDALLYRIKEGRVKDDQYVSFMLHSAFDALQRNMKERAEKTVFKLSMLIKPRTKSFSTYLTLPENLLQSLHGLPDLGRVSVPLFNGLINEDIGQFSKAERVYMQAIIYALDSVNRSQGDQLPETLNEFFLLGRLWQNENRIKDLASLDQVYSLLENRILKSLRKKEEDKLLTEPLARVAELKEQREKQLGLIKAFDTRMAKLKAREIDRQEKKVKNAQAALSAKKKTVTALTREVMLKAVSTLIIQLMLLVLIIGCAVIAWQYSQRLKEHRTYGFFTRFLELSGWLRVFSIVGIVSGFISIIFSQFLQIFQKVHESSPKMIQETGTIYTGNGAADSPIKKNGGGSDRPER